MEHLESINQEKDLPYWIGFNFFEGIGPLRFKLLLEYFGSAQKAWLASKKDLLTIGLGEKIVDKFWQFKDFFNPQSLKMAGHFLISLPDFLSRIDDFLADEERKKQFWWVTKTGRYKKIPDQPILVLTWMDKIYPESLKNIPASPPVIYLAAGFLKSDKKTLEAQIKRLFDKPAIAVVGTRKISSYGRLVTEKLVAQLVEANLVIVSGIARGVDGVAHRTALANNGQTIAVLGSGVDVVYPAENRDIYEKISWSKKNLLGLVLSEFPPGFPPLPGNFPARNRLIAGLAKAVLVTEAAQDSGSLITARLALEQGKDIFAVPGPITSPLSSGTSFLIKQGAKLVTEITDILEELGVKNFKTQMVDFKLEDLSEEERKIWELFNQGEKYIDDIIRETGLETAKVGSILSLMTLKGLIKDLGGGKWGRN